MSESTSGYLSPDEITNKSFDTKRRGGFDPEAVRRHLASVAATVDALSAERSALTARIETLEAQLTSASAQPLPQVELDEDALTERLGKDAARVLAEARAAAADRIAEAEVQADDIRAAAEEVFAERSMAADQEASRLRESAEAIHAERAAEADQSAAAIVARAEADAEDVRSEVASERQSADAEAARIVREAELTRRQILEDLARRRSAARRQIEQLRAGRERLLASHETVRRALDDISEELTISMSEARAAAETAGHSVSETTIEELEAEIETARLTGLLDTGPMPVVSPRPNPRPAPSMPTVVESTEETDAADDTAAPEDDSAVEVNDTAAPVNDTAAPVDDTAVPSGDGLAEVVQLDRARNEVDTATHPATGRDASANRGGVPRAQQSKPAKLEAVETLAEAEPTANPSSEGDAAVASDDEFDAPEGSDDSVESLFASLRSTPATSPVTKASTSVKKSSGAKKSTAEKKSTAKKPAPAKKPETKAPSAGAPDDSLVDSADSAEVARRLKRVLADEQSRAMSSLRSSSTMPSLEELLGEPAGHGEAYWAEVTAQIDQIAVGDVSIRGPIEELVESIRHRVGEALDDAQGDSDSAVTSLRSIYREIKTQRITSCAEEVCRIASGRSAENA